MEVVFNDYNDTYINLLPRELKAILAKYVYGTILIRLITYSEKIISILIIGFVTEKSRILAELTMKNIIELEQYVNIPLPIDKQYAQPMNSNIEIYKDEIDVGTNPVLVIEGHDMTIFMLKLRQLYNHHKTGTLKQRTFYYY